MTNYERHAARVAVTSGRWHLDEQRRMAVIRAREWQDERPPAPAQPVRSAWDEALAVLSFLALLAVIALWLV